ncbi:hypothetical protein [Novosphingobium cyanobacteriorum]|uniref:Uncharacterized protein n=1 Tax=Novosphingobium cyanobacteriorum TaxID=3024215 RepID=A0ABT6CLA4_9SPHN|nr:hypothetical protein [Novosphingobium cyanobacteriorum]MDF8333870.1 hypothetical protein [Novosphingobium cyanobacteriorum]
MIEGRLVGAEALVRELGAWRPDMAIHAVNLHIDVSFGARCLIETAQCLWGELAKVVPLEGDTCACRNR